MRWLAVLLLAFTGCGKPVIQCHESTDTQGTCYYVCDDGTAFKFECPPSQ